MHRRLEGRQWARFESNGFSALWKGTNAPICHTVSTGPETHVRDPWRWYAPHRAIVLLGVVLTLIALAGAFLGVYNASQAESLSAQLTDRYVVLLPPVREIRAAESAFQVLATGAFDSSAPTSATNVAGAETDANAINKSYATLQRLLALPGNAELAPLLDGRMSAYLATQSSLGAFLAGGAHTPQTAQLGCRGGVCCSEARCNLGLPAGHRHRASDHDGGASARGRQPSPGRSLVVHRHRRAHRGDRDRGAHSPRAAGGTSASRARGRPVRRRTENRVRGQPADRTRDVEGGAIRLRSRGRGTEPGCP